MPVARMIGQPLAVGMPADHAPHVHRFHWLVGEFPGTPGQTGEEPGFESGAAVIEEGFQVAIERAMAGHVVPLAAFLVQTDPGALALQVDVLDAHLRGRTDAGEGIGEERHERPVAKTSRGIGVDAIEGLAGFFGRKDRRFAFAHHVF